MSATKGQLTVHGSTPIQYREPNAKLRELRRISKREGRSVAELIREATTDYLDRRNGGAA